MIGSIICFLSVSCRGQSPAEARDSSSSGMNNYSFAERVPRRYQIIGSEANRQHLTWPRFLPFMCLVLRGEFTCRADALRADAVSALERSMVLSVAMVPFRRA